jgi:chromate transporter
VTLGALFLGFLRVAASGFGGVLPWARLMLVEERGWLDDREFTDVLGLSQFLPGPNIVNVSIVVGARFHGVRGALVAFAGLMAVPVALVLVVAVLYARHGGLVPVQGALAGVSAAAAGLVVAMGIRMAAPYRWHPGPALFALLAFVAVAIVRWPLPCVLLVLAPLGIAAAWKRHA